jgi:hypothetical protein
MRPQSLASGVSVIPEPSLATITRGDFGTAVRMGLTQLGLTLTEVTTGLLGSASAAESRTVIVLESRPARRLFSAVDEFVFRSGASWLPVINEHRQIRIGPLMVAPSGPCHLCYESRRLQHDRKAPLDFAIEDAWDDGAITGPGLFLPHHVSFAAAQIIEILCSTERGQFTVLSKDRGIRHRFRQETIEAAHGCRRCHD